MWFVRGGAYHNHKADCTTNPQATFKSFKDCVLRGVSCRDPRPGRYYCVLCGWTSQTKEQTLHHMQHSHTKSQLQRFGFEVLVKRSEHLAND